MTFSPIALGVVAGMMIIGVIILAVFGIKNVVSGKHEVQKIVSLIVPGVIFGISYLITQSASDAGMLTATILLGFMGLLILYSGVRSIF